MGGATMVPDGGGGGGGSWGLYALPSAFLRSWWR